VQIVDRRLFKAKRRGLGFGLVQHRRSSSAACRHFGISDRRRQWPLP
jgi:hypothetical protein